MDGGSYVTRGRREGRLGLRQRAVLSRLADAVDLEAQHLAEGSHRSTLRVGEKQVAWAGPPPTPALRALVGALARLGAPV
ncbi:MAG: hypothetical protein AAGK21_06875 [Bacteroidota bacterium]